MANTANIAFPSPLIMQLARLMPPVRQTEPQYDPVRQIAVTMGKNSSTSERSSSTKKTAFGDFGPTDSDRKRDD